MRLDQMNTLKGAVETARLSSAHVEWVDTDGERHVVVGVGPRDDEPDPVAFLAGGCYVTLEDGVPADFRLVSPAIPFECPGKDCEVCKLAPVCPKAVLPIAEPVEENRDNDIP